MERNKKKSKALIITFIVVLLLLVAFYFLVIKNNPLDTKGASTQNKGFFSLFSSSKKDSDLNPIDSTSVDKDSTDSDSGNIVGGDIDIDTSDTDDSDTDLINSDTPIYNPKLSPIPTPKPYDADNDPPKNPNKTDPYTPTPKPQTLDKKQCNFDDYKLKFTEAEQAELDKLLREFYRIASSIKTQEDIDLEYEAKKSYISLVDEAKELTKQCYAQTSDPKYLAGFDWKNSQSDDLLDASGNIISQNYSRKSEPRTEKRPNPWFGSDKGNGYFYETSLINRSDRFNGLYDYMINIGNRKFYDSKEVENYFIKTYGTTDTYRTIPEALNACLVSAKAKAEGEKNKLPSGYSLNYNCFKLNMDNLKTDRENVTFVQRDMWYPLNNKNNTPSSDIDQTEYYPLKTTCEKRAGGAGTCNQQFKGDNLEIKLQPYNWAYGITARSETFSSFEACNNAKNYFKHSGDCINDGSEQAYIQKIWKDIDLGTNKSRYIVPINYHIFERLFYVW